MKIKLLNVRLAFPALFEPKSVTGTDKPKFGASLLLQAGDAQVKSIAQAIDAVGREKWGAKADATLKSLRAGDKCCLHNGDLKSQYDGFEGTLYISASNPIRPTVVDSDKSPLAASDGKPYAGCYVHAVVEIWAQDNQYGKRVNATLMGVQFSKDGEAFSGGGVADVDEFDDITSGVDAESFV